MALITCAQFGLCSPGCYLALAISGHDCLLLPQTLRIPGSSRSPPWHLQAPTLQLNLSCCSRAPSSAFILGSCALPCLKAAPRTKDSPILILLPSTCTSPLSLQVLQLCSKGSARCSSVCTDVAVTLLCFLLGL